MSKFVLLTLSVLLLSSSGTNLPSWPKQFRFFYGHNTSGFNCITIHEPASPVHNDNKLCWESGHDNPGFRWSYAGAISGMKCTRYYDPINYHWRDNYLCLPSNSPYNFTFHYGGKPIGTACLSVNEPAERGWADNYLCAAAGSGPSF